MTVLGRKETSAGYPKQHRSGQFYLITTDRVSCVGLIYRS